MQYEDSDRNIIRKDRHCWYPFGGSFELLPPQTYSFLKGGFSKILLIIMLILIIMFAMKYTGLHLPTVFSGVCETFKSIYRLMA